MKGFLLDENLPIRLRFDPGLPIVHASEIAASASDSRIWNFAKENELVILTKDSDFFHRILVSEPPPWVVHFRFGNLTRNDFHARMAEAWPLIMALLPEHRLIVVGMDVVEALAF